MILADAVQPFQQSPLGVALISFACIALLTISGAALKILLDIARMQASVTALVERVGDVERDPDIMRWSNYGRATQALGVTPMQQGNP